MFRDSKDVDTHRSNFIKKLKSMELIFKQINGLKTNIGLMFFCEICACSFKGICLTPIYQLLTVILLSLGVMFCQANKCNLYNIM